MGINLDKCEMIKSKYFKIIERICGANKNYEKLQRILEHNYHHINHSETITNFLLSNSDPNKLHEGIYQWLSNCFIQLIDDTN